MDKSEIVYFQREAFRGDFQNVPPKWHILRATDNLGWFIALCGYYRPGHLGNVKQSQSKAGKPKSVTCEKCLAQLERNNS